MSNKYPSMKTVNITFETAEHKRLVELKGNRSWRNYILEIADAQKSRECGNDV